MTASPSDELWAPAVDLRYALRGGDVIPTDRPMGYLFARHGDAWYLRSDTALDSLGRRTWRGPWDFAPCVVTTTEHGIVLSHPGNQPMVDRLVRELDTSVQAVSELWPTTWSQRVALMLPDTPGEMRALVGPDFPVESVVAVAVADRVDNKTRTVAGQRVVLSPSGVRALSIASLRVVLRHEITHLAARADTVDGSPTWLLEGFADYVGYRDSGVTLAEGAPDLAKRVRQDGPPTALPEDRAFRSRGPELDLAYQQSWSLARYIADRYGEKTLIAVYRKLAGCRPGLGAGDRRHAARRARRGPRRRSWRAGSPTSERHSSRVSLVPRTLVVTNDFPPRPRWDPVLPARAGDPAAGGRPGRLRAGVGRRAVSSTPRSRSRSCGIPTQPDAAHAGGRAPGQGDPACRGLRHGVVRRGRAARAARRRRCGRPARERVIASTHGHEVGWSMLPGARQALRRIGDRPPTS